MNNDLNNDDISPLPNKHAIDTLEQKTLRRLDGLIKDWLRTKERHPAVAQACFIAARNYAIYAGIIKGGNR